MSFRYFQLGPRPVRVTFDDQGRPVSAESWDPAKGALVIDNRLLTRVLDNPEAVEITEAAFTQSLARLA